MHRRQREAADSVEEATQRRRMLRIVPFCASAKSHSLRCSSFPHTTRFAGLVRGPRCLRCHTITALYLHDGTHIFVLGFFFVLRFRVFFLSFLVLVGHGLTVAHSGVFSLLGG